MSDNVSALQWCIRYANSRRAQDEIINVKMGTVPIRMRKQPIRMSKNALIIALQLGKHLLNIVMTFYLSMWTLSSLTGECPPQEIAA